MSTLHVCTPLISSSNDFSNTRKHTSPYSAMTMPYTTARGKAMVT